MDCINKIEVNKVTKPTMIIESPELLRQWLTGFLAPLCDADPEALAKYCLALVRKDRPESELRQGMMEQLDVFLQGNTKSFVDKFLQVVHAKSYIPKGSNSSSTTNSSAPSASANSSKVNTEEATKEPGEGAASATAVASIRSNSSHSPDSTTASPVVAENGTAAATNGEPTPPPPPPAASAPAPPPPPPEVAPPMPLSSVITRKEEVSSSQRTRKQDIDMRNREDRPPRGRRRSPSPIGRGRSRSRSRSRSRDRRRSRSRDRGRSGRNRYEDRRRRSPPTKRYRRSRTRSRTRSPRRSKSPRRSRSRDRERRSKSRNNRSTSPRGRAGRERSPVMRSPSSPVKAVIREEKETSPGGGSSSPVREVRAPSDSSNSTLLPSIVTKPPPKQRCRDYDEKGYCMRGDMCPYDHGSDPVVLEGIGGVLDFPPPPVPGAGPPTAPGYTPVSVPPQGVPRPRGPPPRQQFDEYTPRAPGIWGSQPPVRGPGNFFAGGPRPRFTAPPPPLPGMPGGNRELINIPVSTTGPHGQSGGSVRPSLAKRLGPVMGGPRAHKQPPGLDNLTLELRSIPQGLNSITHLNDHFAKFGKINNIMVEHEGSPDAALVTFSSYSEANAAYRSTEAVLNNRFIKVFWHNPNKGENYHFNGGGRSVLDRLGTRHVNKSLNNTLQDTDEKNEKVILSRGSLVKTVYNTSAVASMAPPESTQSAVDQKKQEIDAIIKQRELMQAELNAKNKQEKQKAEASKLKADMEKRKQQLMEKQMQQLKILLTRLDTNKATMKSEDKKTLLTTIKSLQSAIDTTREQLLVKKEINIDKPQTGPKLDKEIMDTELDLYNTKAEGGDISRIQKKLLLLRQQQLQQQQAILSSYAARGRGANSYARGGYMVRGSARGRGVIRGRGRGRGYGGQFASVDRRTTKINASGFEREDKEEVLAHFSNLGPITTYDWDDQTPAVNIIYAARHDAEKAMAEGRTLGDRLLTLTWVYEPHTPSHVQPVTPSIPAQAYHQMHTPHTTQPTLSNEHDTMEEITEEIVEEVEGEGSLIGDGDSSSVMYEEEEEEVEEEDEEARSWRR